MRVVPFSVSFIITIALIIVLDRSWGPAPAVGKFLSPQHGFWQNAEPVDYDFSEQLSFPNLKGRVEVYLDDRLVPHVFAEQDEDVYFAQGYLHAKFRLWQMEFQTMAAAGRISEILGADERFLRFDREQRRLGMTYAAENAVKEIEQDADSKKFFDAYTAGVNAYIHSLTEGNLPIEYKLLGYKPEQWSNYKIALFLKQMSKTLAGFERDIEFTNLKSVFSEQQMQVLFPQIPDSLQPIVPKGTVFPAPGIIPEKPATADSLYFNNDTTLNVAEVNKPDRSNGSNSWAISGQKTKSGSPILCNDPHLELTFPSIWYEMQLTTPTMNVYGASFPGSPSVIIGFNDHIAFGFTNAQRDVKDYYAIRFNDASKKEYWFNGGWQNANLRVEEIKVKGGNTVYDTVAYTLFGPVMYDESFTSDFSGNKAIAVRWTAHDPSNEGAMWFKLNRAKSYVDFEEAIRPYACPGQNMTFASKAGDIALWQQGKFPAQWAGQGRYVMPGEDSSYLWQGFIPQEENPHVINPGEGFIQSANQRPADSAYPYFIPGNYITSRGITIANRLAQMQGITPEQMMALQNDYHSSLAADALPLLFRYIQRQSLDATAAKYLAELRQWNVNVTADSRAATIYQAWMDSLEKVIWQDDFAPAKDSLVRPDEITTIELLLRDSASSFIDDRSTPDTVESIQQQVTKAFQIAALGLAEEEKTNGLAWWKHKHAGILHLLRTALMPFGKQDMKVGGWGNTVNAITVRNGPSWRMIVHLATPTEAYGIYPGGQSGNPGSIFYDNFVNTWMEGKYYTLWIMKREEAGDKRIRGRISFTNF